MKSENLKSTFPGIINKILVGTGDTFQKGQELFIVEAMKMENVITAMENGTCEKKYSLNKDK